MRLNKYIYALMSAAMMSAACNKEASQYGEHGYMTAKVSQDDDVVIVSTKAEVTADDPFKIDIYKGNTLVKTIDDHRTLMNSPLELGCDTYKVTAANRDAVPATFDSPRYYGESNVKILPQQITNAQITCSLADVLVATTFTSDFSESFTSYSLTVSNGEGELVWSSIENNLDNTGYFNVTGSLTWTLSLVTKDGRTLSLSDSYTEVKVKQKYLLNFKIEAVDPDTGALGPVRIILDDEITEREFDLYLDFTSAEAEVTSVNAWSYYANISGMFKGAEIPEGLKLQYKKLADENWIDFEGELTTNADANQFTALLTGLESGTDYVARAVTAKELGKKQISFTTEGAEILYNMSFDDWYQDGRTWMPSADASQYIWDSANPGSAPLLGKNPTTPTDYVAVSGTGKQAAQLTSQYVVIKFAAGNLFTGKFGSLEGTAGAKLDWGTPFHSRPLALKGYYDYSPVAIDYAQDPYNDMKGQMDICQLQIFLTDRTEMYHISTSNEEFVDINGSDIIAYGKLENNASTNGYQPFTINLEYRDTRRKPNMIVIVASASKYGDYFTGGNGSTLYLDEFSFVYDPAEL